MKVNFSIAVILRGFVITDCSDKYYNKYHNTAAVDISLPENENFYVKIKTSDGAFFNYDITKRVSVDESNGNIIVHTHKDDQFLIKYGCAEADRIASFDYYKGILHIQLSRG